MPTLLESLEQHFAEMGWPTERIEGLDALALLFEGQNARWQCVARAWEDHEEVAFFSIFPVRVLEPRRAAMMELLTRANYGIIVGNFEMDLEDGEIRYKTTMAAPDKVLDQRRWKKAVGINLRMLDRYAPGILALCEAEVPPRELLAKIEEM